MAQCTNCGRELDEGLAFCPACGKAVDNRAHDAAAQTQVQPQPAPQPQLQATPQPQPQPTPQPTPVFNPYAQGANAGQAQQTTPVSPSFSPKPYTPPPSKVRSTLSLVFSILSLVLLCPCCCFSRYILIATMSLSVLFGILAIVFAVLSRKDTGGKMQGVAIGGTIIAVISIILAIIMVIVLFAVRSFVLHNPDALVSEAQDEADADSTADILGMLFGKEVEEAYRKAAEKRFGEGWDAHLGDDADDADDAYLPAIPPAVRPAKLPTWRPTWQPVMRHAT